MSDRQAQKMDATVKPMTDTKQQLRLLERALSEVNKVILGKERQVRLAMCCLLARGHLLIEDMPGVGKTTLAQILARILGLDFKRVQFTSDLLPADLIGVSIFDSNSHSFRFHPGPIFASVVLADEINRATPKAQSALLEAMEERQITAEGTTYQLPEPFYVIATQNPRHQVGTFPLPESQLDRFLMRIDIGYPDRVAERNLLKVGDRRQMLQHIDPVLDATSLVGLQRRVNRVQSSDALLDYIQDLLAATRQSHSIRVGLSPRAGLALAQCARAWAMLADRDMVLPEDIQAVAPSVIAHRLQPTDDSVTGSQQVVERLIQSVAIP